MLGIALGGPNRMEMHDYQELCLTGSTSRGKRFSIRMPSTKAHSQTSAKSSNEKASASPAKSSNKHTSALPGPPHKTTPLVGPDTAHSSSRIVRPSQAQREVSALNERLADAEAIISRQESELAKAKSQASAIRSQMGSQRKTTRFIDQDQMEAIITESNKNRSKNIEA
ncbi:unnamed protein product [Penicillium viridicatum]